MAEADPKKNFNVHDAKTHLSKLNDRAHAGEEIILARAGEPWAKIVPYASVELPSPRQPGRFKHLFGKISEGAIMAPCFTGAELDAIENADILPPHD